MMRRSARDWEPMPFCYLLEPDHIPDEGDHYGPLADMEGIASFLEELGHAKAVGVEGPPIYSRMRLCDGTHGNLNDGYETDFPTIGLSAFPSFCSALAEELSLLGLRCMWHEGKVHMRPGYLNGVSTDPGESAREFMCVSWA